MKSISMIKEEFKNLTPEQIPAQIALYQEDERKGVQNFLLSQQKKVDKYYQEIERIENLCQYEKEYSQYDFICGIDEVGRGPLAGPVVAGAVVLPKGSRILYINDSKKLSAKKREELFDIIKEELIEIRDKFGDERKTKIVAAEGEIDLEDLIKEEQCVVALTHFGYIKRMPIDTYKSQRRGGKGITGIATREDDFVKQIFTASTHDMILFFTNKGKLYKLRGYEVPEAGRTAKGTAIVNLLSLDPGEKVSAVIPIQNFADGKYLLMATKNGLIKKTALKEYDTTRKTGLQGITLKDEDELIGVRLTDGEDNVVLVTKNGLCITFDEKDVRPIGRVAQGVIGIRLDDDDDVIGMESVIVGGKATLLAITENGFGKRTELDEYRVQKRGGRGVITYKITPKTGKIVGVRIATEEDDVMLITDKGTIIRINVKDVSILGRSTQGVTLMRTNDGGKVVSIETLTPDIENE